MARINPDHAHPANLDGAAGCTAPGSPDEAAHFKVYAHFLSRDPTKHRDRFYTIIWQESLFGGGALILSWGRFGTNGRQLITSYPDRSSAQPQVDRIVKRRIKRGYRLLDAL
jgi:predicted DNA-binding WGR domain protein